jgi:glutaredoxin-related protein
MRTILNPDDIHPNIKDEVANFQSDIVQEVAKTVAESRVVVVGMRYNPAVSKARDALKDSGIDFIYLEYGSYTSEWHKRLALKMWTGWPTFPMIFVEQKLVGGRKDLLALLKEGGKLSLHIFLVLGASFIWMILGSGCVQSGLIARRKPSTESVDKSVYNFVGLPIYLL